ncbi:MAG: excinuclease ABC subunit UvrC [Candidatus Latescibacterota bacterium]
MGSSVIKKKILAQIKQLPHEPGVYIFKDTNGAVIYVGKAKDLINRVRSYAREGGDSRYHIQFLIQRADTLEYIVTDTEQEALILENNLIKKHRPRYNIFLRDDKTYVNLRLNTRHPFPRLTVVRNPKSDGASYFGPFASAGSVRATLRIIGRIFPMRTCTDTELNLRKRPCLYYHIKRCPAPCVGLIDPQKYCETVTRVTMFLKGKRNELAKSMKKKMELLSAERRYEEAAQIRDVLWAIQRTVEKQRITSPHSAERDVFGAFRDDEQLVIHCLFVRDGKLSGGEAFHFHNANLSTGEHLSSFLSQYYQRGAVIPHEVVVSQEIPGKSALEAWLSGRRKDKVEVIRPRRGERMQTLKLALKNAEIASKEWGLSARNKDLLEDLRDLLNLRKFPHRIECFDVSNLQGRDAVASRVTFIDGDPAKTLYRHYRIRTVSGPDDYAMMEEVLERRIARGITEGDLPELLILDGGRGQLNVARKVIERLGAEGMDAVGIAKVREHPASKGGGQGSRASKRLKGKERIYVAGLPEPLLLEGNSTALFLLQRIRDEAHRFAVSHHKKLRSKRIAASALDEVRGVGPVLKRRLIGEFGSVAKLSQASVDSIATVPGVSRALARAIKDALS